MPTSITKNQIAICWKRPKWDIDLSHTGFSVSELVADYRRRKRDPDRAQQSAARQRETKRMLSRQFLDDAFIPRNDLNRPALDEKKIFVVGGGDNHAIWSMRYVPRRDVAMVLVNSDVTDDPSTGSHGGVLNFTTQQFLDHLPQILAGEYEVEHWPLIEVEVNRQRVLVGSEVFLGETENTAFSGNFIEFGEQSARAQGSGTLIATGAGTQTGSWFNAATYFIPTRIGPQPKTARAMYLTNMAQNRGRPIEFDMDIATIDGDQEITVTSMNDKHGIVQVDSLEGAPWIQPFPEQRKAIVRIAPDPLMVVKNPYAS